MALTRSAVTAGSNGRLLFPIASQPFLALSLRQLSTSSADHNTDAPSTSAQGASFSRSKSSVVPTTSSTSTTAQSTGTGSRTGYNALAKAEQKVAKQQRGMARQMPGMSLENQDQMLADPYILPPLHVVGISNVGGLIPSLNYIFTRIRRYARLSIHSMSEIVKREPIIVNSIASSKYKALPWYQRFWSALQRTRPTVSMQPLSDHLAEIWEKWNKAQASGDLDTIRQVSVSKALEIAKNRAQNQPGGGAVMTWTVDRYLSKPRAVDARVLPVDPAGETYLAQVIVKLETSQTVTIKPRSRAAQTLHSNATEFYAFEKILSNNEAKWKIKEKITPYAGGDLPKDLM
ncbi:hypothetical protein NliqN6_3111 [Naganishia liquefaciens]|uniref:Tim44-like domain-containing protein n=1 Tax=Naganishia liquefaciens TaxID=104408 RepID=A0A8H3YEP7_9TREE|nr:hypothetical protein NliqN6_3111 [Naganishia liquefaciens]